jgi:hypothetical protein
MKTSKIILISFFLFMSMPIVKSQVTIGSGAEPGKAALLDLKTKPADANNVTIEAGKPGGLILPRVQLTKLNTLDPFINSTSSEEWTNLGKQADNKKFHTGMMVYNLTDDATFKPGIYFWDSSQWVAAKSTATVVGANNGLSKSGDDIQLGGTLSANTTVNPNGKSLEFSGALKIDNPGSKVFMDGTKNNFPVQSTAALGRVASLGIDTLTGEVLTMRSAAGSTTKAINYIEYHITGKGDWVKNFHTYIDTTKYTVVIAGFRFVPATSAIGIKPGTHLYPKGDTDAQGYPHESTSKSSKFTKSPLVNVFADSWEVHDGKPDVRVSYWVIHADYAEAEPDDEKDGMWIINCLVINNSLVKFYPVLEFKGIPTAADREHVYGVVPAGLN